MKGERRTKEGRRGKRIWVILLGTGLLSLLLLSFVFLWFLKPPPSTVPSESTPPSRPEPQHPVIEGKVTEKSSLFKSLIEKNISPQRIDLIISKLKPYLDFKRIKGGSYRLFTDGKGDLTKFIFEAGPAEVYEIEKDSQGFTAQKKAVSLQTYWTKVAGEIHSSLFEAMDAVGERDPLGIAFAEVLAWEVDFYKDVREGDRFKAVVEKVYKGDQFIQYGPIQVVEYEKGDRIIRGVRYQGEYYNEKGISLKKAFLKAPLRFNRISSKFSRARRHPILGGVRPHYGVDYAAPSGTAIWAVADGTVLSCGWSGGFGNQVTLRHPNGYTTHYGHLTRFGPGIRKGVRVKQQQIIGYVGSTGLSTGPHLDYRLAKGGQPRNPLKEIFPSGLPIGSEAMEGFQRRKEEMMAWLQGNEPLSKRVEAVEGSPQNVLGRVGP